MHASILTRLGERLKPGELWHNPGFLTFWAAQTISRFGSEIGTLTLPLLAALTLDASPSEMGALFAAATAPFLLIGLLVGVWVDRLRRRPLLVVSDVVRAALLVTIPVTWAAGWLSMGLLYAVALSVGVLSVFFEVASLSHLPAMVGRESLVEANGKLEMSRSLAQIGGPGLAGWLVSLLGAPLAVLLDAASYLASAVFLARLDVQEEVPGSSPIEQRRVLREVGEGLRAVFASSLLRPLVLCSATTNLSGCVFLAVYVLYLTEDLGLRSTTVGLVFALGGAGALLGATVADTAARRFGRGPTMVGAQLLCGISGMAVPLAVAAPAVALPMVLASEFAQWLFLVVYRVGEVSVRQQVTPNYILGRVNATERFMVYGAIPLGALLGGLLGETIGVPSTLVCGMLGILLAALWPLLSPLRSLY